MNSLKVLLPYLSQNRLTITLGLLCLIVVDLLQLMIPRIIKRVVDELTDLTIAPEGLMKYALTILLLGLFIAFFRYLWRRCLLGTSRTIEEGLRNQLFSHLQTLSSSYFDKVSTGDLMAHATNDIKQVRMATGMGMVAFNDAVVLGTAAIGFMAYINVKLTLIVLIPMPAIVLGTRFFSRKMHRRYQQVQGTFARLTEVVRERIAGIRIIKAYTRENESAEEVSQISRDYVDENIRLVRIVGTFFPMMLFLTNLSLAAILYFGGRLTILTTITPGDFVAFISYLGLLTWPMMALGWVTNLIQRGKASMDRIEAILQTQPEIAETPGATPLTDPKGALSLETVTFTYHPNDDPDGAVPVLDNIALQVEPGKTLGIVGPPGSGKTTLLNLIPRLYDAGSGNVLIDGRDIRKVKISDLRAAIAFMPQEPFLFAGTVRDNITLADPNVSDDRLVEAARKAAVYDTICSLPQGFDTIVGEKGVILSGGQKQRIALARALLQESSVLILDDPVSQVDVETGNRIIEHLRSLSGKQTVVIVSHRLAALSFADRIVSLENGRIVESGNHAELMAKGGYYAAAYGLQQLEDNLHAH